MKKIIKLTDEELLMVRGGTDKEKYNSVGEIIRRTNLKYAQDVVREAAIYQPYAKGNSDYEGAAKNVTWCNQSSFDVMEATGVHMEAFYGEPKGYKGTKGERGAGYWVDANTACKNVENYIENYAKNYADYIMLNEEKGINTKTYPIDDSGNILKEVLYAEGKDKCPIQEITAEQAQDLANQGYTVVAMWENPSKKLNNGKIIQGSGHIATVRPDLDKDKPTTDPQISNVGSSNKLTTVSEGFFQGF